MLNTNNLRAACKAGPKAQYVIWEWAYNPLNLPKKFSIDPFASERFVSKSPGRGRKMSSKSETNNSFGSLEPILNVKKCNALSTVINPIFVLLLMFGIESNVSAITLAAVPIIPKAQKTQWINYKKKLN